MATKAELVKGWLEQIWYHNDMSTLDRMFSNGTKATGPVSDIDSDKFQPREIVSTLKSLLKSTPEITFTLIEETDNWVITRFVVDVRKHPSRPPFSFDGQMLFKFQMAEVCEIHSQVNYIALFEGLGQMPTDTLPIILTGANLSWR